MQEFTLFDGKVCTRCKEWKSFSEYTPRNETNQTHGSHCKACRNAKHRKEREERANGLILTITEFRCTTCGEVKPISEFYRNIASSSGISYACKPCYKKRVNRYRNANRAKASESERRSRHRKREHYRELEKRKAHRRRAKIAGNGGNYTQEEWIALCAKYGNRCLKCGRSDVQLTADHVLPIHKGGTNNIDNIQPMCLSCNCSKGKKHIDYRIEGG